MIPPVPPPIAGGVQRRLRLEAVDATRGAAMLLVCLSHFADEYFRAGEGVPAGPMMHTFGMIASPTFMVISGMMLGFLARTRGGDGSSFPGKAVDRGLFYLSAGHFLIALAYWPMRGGYLRSLESVFITDAIGLYLVVGPLVVRHTRPAFRVVASFLAYCLAWMAVLTWFPTDPHLRILKHVLFGIEEGFEPSILWYSFPLVPWGCVYMASSVAGERLAELFRNHPRKDSDRFVARLAAASLLAATLTIVVWKFEKVTGVIADPSSIRYAWVSVYQKSPPGPIYLTFFGGCGLLLLSLMLRYHDRPSVRFLADPLKTVGRVSFFVFVFQYFLYEFLLHTLKLHYSPLWPLYFAASIALILVCARFWHARGYNRFLSVYRLAPPSVRPRGD